MRAQADVSGARSPTHRLQRLPQIPSRPGQVQKVGEVSHKNAGRAAHQAAKLTGTNRQYVPDAQTIKAKAPDVFEKVKDGGCACTRSRARGDSRSAASNVQQYCT
jgi:hypothetical protein